MDLIILLELALVAAIIAVQVLVALRNNDHIKRFGHLIPRTQDLETGYAELEAENQASGAVHNTIRLLEDNPRFSPIFREILQQTNAYLVKNRGAAEADTLREITLERVASQEKSIESNLTLRLYIGLLCTFTGVIIGLVKIAVVGVSDAAIQSFIGGVLIGMIGSASGLALTVRSNYRFKEDKQQLDERMYRYLAFLRDQILPALHREPQDTSGSLRKNLAAFNEGFAQYQQHMNESLTETLGLFAELKDVFRQIRSIELGLKGMGQAFQANVPDGEKRGQATHPYARRAKPRPPKPTRHCAHMDKQLESLVNENLRAMDQQTQSAYLRMEQFAGNGNGNGNGNSSHALVRTLPHTDLSQLRTELETLQEINLQIHNCLLEQNSQGHHAQQDLGEQFRQIDSRLAQVIASHESSLLNAPEFRFFLYAGVAAFVTTLAGGLVYLINTLVL